MRERDAQARDAVAIQHRLRVRAGLHQGRAVGIAANAEIRRADHAEGGFPGKEFAAGFLGREPRGQAGESAGPVARVLEFTRGEEAAPDLRVLRPRSSLSTRAISTVSRPQRGWWWGRRFTDVDPACARTTRAVFMPPNPRQRTRPMSPQAAGVPRRPARGPVAGSSVLRRGDAGRDTLVQRHQGQHQIENARSRNQVAEGPLESGDRRRSITKDAADAPGLRSVRGPGAIAVRDDQAHLVRANPGIGEG